MDFPGGWPGDAVNGFTGEGLTDRQRNAQDYLKRLVSWRKTRSVIHSGRLMHYAPDGGVYVYFRYDDRDTVMVAFNKSHEPAALDARRFAERLTGRRVAHDVIEGRRFELGDTIEIPARGLLLLDIER